MTRCDIPEEVEPLCDYHWCAAGEGVAGCGFCFLGGNPMDANCQKFVPEPDDMEIISAMIRMMGEEVEC